MENQELPLQPTTPAHYKTIIAKYRKAVRGPIHQPSDNEMAGLEIRHQEMLRFERRAQRDHAPDLPDIKTLVKLQRRMLVRLRASHAKLKRKDLRNVQRKD